MSENMGSNTLGEQFRDALSEGLNSGDFKNLNELVGQTVNNAIREANYTFMGGARQEAAAAHTTTGFRQIGLRRALLVFHRCSLQ